jgi:hypothetical protein
MLDIVAGFVTSDDAGMNDQMLPRNFGTHGLDLAWGIVGLRSGSFRWVL